MLRQSLNQKLNQKLSPRQIQLMKLIQLPSIELDTRIKEELEINPVLEISDYNSTDSIHESTNPSEGNDTDFNDNDSSVETSDQDYYSEYKNPFEYYYNSNSDDENEDDGTILVKNQESFFDYLKNQLDLLELNQTERIIAEHIIGSIDEDGYLRRNYIEISDDLAFKYNLYIDIDEIKKIIKQIQQFEPAGIAAMDLQECLIIQIERNIQNAKDENERKLFNTTLFILKKSFQELTKKHYPRILEQHKISEDEFKSILQIITKLSPKPGLAFNHSSNYGDTQYTQPDFFVSVEGENVTVSLYNDYTPDLKISGYYQNMLVDIEKRKNKKNKSDSETEQFIKQKIDSAKWFIDALQQRKITLLTTMRAIVDKQINFFKTGNPNELKPMILKDIADMIDMDISTISRVSRSKYVQTQFGIFPLKYFFTESFSMEEGEDISIIKIKNLLKEIIENEDKKNPFSDSKLSEIMTEKGFPIARRTIAKYRDQMNIPVAQLRKEL